MISSFSYFDTDLFISKWGMNSTKYNSYTRAPDQVFKTGFLKKDSSFPLTQFNSKSEYVYYAYATVASNTKEGGPTIWKAYEARKNKNSEYQSSDGQTKVVLENRLYCGDRPKIIVMACHYTNEVSIINLGTITVNYTVDSVDFTRSYSSPRLIDGSIVSYLDHLEASPNAEFSVNSFEALTITNEAPCVSLTKEMIFKRIEDANLHSGLDPFTVSLFLNSKPGLIEEGGKRYFPGCTLDDKGTKDNLEDDVISEASWPWQG